MIFAAGSNGVLEVMVAIMGPEWSVGCVLAVMVNLHESTARVSGMPGKKEMEKEAWYCPRSVSGETMTSRGVPGTFALAVCTREDEKNTMRKSWTHVWNQ